MVVKKIYEDFRIEPQTIFNFDLYLIPSKTYTQRPPRLRLRLGKLPVALNLGKPVAGKLYEEDNPLIYDWLKTTVGDTATFIYQPERDEYKLVLPVITLGKKKIKVKAAKLL